MREPRHRSVRELRRGLLMSPPAVRRRHTDRLEALLLELDPQRTYPFEFLYYRVTGFRPAEQSQQTFRGEEVMPDLLLVLDALSETVPAPVGEARDQVMTVEQVAGRHNVSVRTVRRWRRRGLVARKYVFPDGRVRVGVRREALRKFEQLRGEQLRKSGNFSRMDAEEERQIIERVEQLRREDDLSLTEAAAQVAEHFDRSQESVRQLLKRFSEEHPERELLRGQAGKIGRADRRHIYRGYRQGAPVEELAEQYARSRSSIYRIINQERARDLLDLRVQHVPDEDFRLPEFETEKLGRQWETLLGRLELEQGEQAAAIPQTEEEETALFRAYNYTKYLLAEGRQELNPRRYVSARLLDRLEKLQRRTERIRQALLRAYQPAAEQVARQHAGDSVSLQDLLCRARSGLSQAIDTFDYRSPAPFPSFLKLHLQKRFARLTSAPEGEASGRQ